MALPGVKTVIKDRFYSITRQDIPVGPKICLIAKRGEAVSGDNSGLVKDLDVIQATSEKDVVSVFGENSDVHRGFVELVSGGAEKVYIVPLPSDTTWNYSSGTVSSSSSGLTDTQLFDAIFDAAEVCLADIIVPWGRGSKASDFVDNGSATPGYPANAFGFVADNATSVANSFITKVGNKIKSISETSYPCFAVMGVKPYVDGTSETMTPGEVSTHIGSGLTNLISRDASTYAAGGANESANRYVVAIASELKPVGYKSDWGFANGATTFAAAISRMASFTSPINKTAYNVASISYNPTRSQQTTLADLGVNFIALNFNRIPTFVEGLTMAASTSDYTRISTFRIVTEAATLVRQVCQKFIGEASTLQTRNSMETAITSALRGMQQMGAVLDSDFTVSYYPADNKAFVDLVITPAFELKSIEVQVAITI